MTHTVLSSALSSLKTIKSKTQFFVVLFFLVFSAQVFASQPAARQLQASSSDIYINHTSQSSVQLAWDAWGPAGTPYNIKVKNLNTNQIEGNYQTSGTTLNVQGLKVGSSYVISVEKSNYIVVDTTEM